MFWSAILRVTFIWWRLMKVFINKNVTQQAMQSTRRLRTGRRSWRREIQILQYINNPTAVSFSFQAIGSPSLRSSGLVNTESISPTGVQWRFDTKTNILDICHNHVLNNEMRMLLKPALPTPQLVSPPRVEGSSPRARSPSCSSSSVATL